MFDELPESWKTIRFQNFKIFCQERLEDLFQGFWRRMYSKELVRRFGTIELLPGEIGKKIYDFIYEIYVLEAYKTVTGLPEDDIFCFYKKFATRERIENVVTTPRVSQAK